MFGVIDLRPLCQRGCFQPGRRDGCQHILAAHAVGQRDLAGLRAENRQVRGIRSRTRHLQLYGHVHVPHTHIVLNGGGFDRQICLDRQCAHVRQCSRKSRNQRIQRLILRRVNTGFDQSRTLSCCGPILCQDRICHGNPILHYAAHCLRLIHLGRSFFRNKSCQRTCWVAPIIKISAIRPESIR